MSTDNPFAAPTTAPVPEAVDLTAGLGALDWAAVKRLRNASHSIRSLGALWMIGVLVCLFAVVAGVSRNSKPFGAFEAGIFTVFAALGSVAIYGAWARPAWGRGVGMVLCILNLASLPIGTIIGILGLIAYSRGKPLFGPGRWTHREVEARYRELKAQRR